MIGKFIEFFAVKIQEPLTFFQEKIFVYLTVNWLKRLRNLLLNELVSKRFFEQFGPTKLLRTKMEIATKWHGQPAETDITIVSVFRRRLKCLPLNY